MNLTTIQESVLNEIAAACDENLRVYPEAGGWCRTFHLSGASNIRSARVAKPLIKKGLIEGGKPAGSKQTQWSWRITEAGRDFLKTSRKKAQ